MNKKRMRGILNSIYSSCILIIVFILSFQTIDGGKQSTRHDIEDPQKESLVLENDIFLISESPSLIPTLSPTFSPSDYPSLHPTIVHSSIPSVSLSNRPSFYPTLLPTLVPSLDPTLLPTLVPSLDPTNVPTTSFTSSPIEDYPLGDVPTGDIYEPSSIGYFNYNPNDDKYGPGQKRQKTWYYNVTSKSSMDDDNNNDDDNHIVMENENIIMKSFEYLDYEGNTWIDVKNNEEYYYWQNFDMNRTLGNRCSSDPKRKQSPIDLCETHVNSECLEHHQIRNRGGEYNLNDTEVQLKILPSKLRIEYSRVNSHLDRNFGLVPPHSDFPLNWNGYISAVHIDIKIPSEHTICGKRYAGEYQIFFYHPKRRQPIVQSVLIEIHPKGRPHKHFQKALNEWQALYDLKHLECQYYKRKKRLMEKVSSITTEDVEDRRELQTNQDDDDSIESLEELLLWARHRTTNPIFDSVYEGLVQSFERNAMESNKQGTNSTSNQNQFYTDEEQVSLLMTTECKKDHDELFLLEDYNHTCCDLTQHHLQWGCKQDRLVDHCPHTCATIQWTIDNNITSPSSSTLTTTPSPTTSPTQTPRPVWNPFWPRIINSIHFYGYGGSLTEPPCSEWVAWRVLDTPMQISLDQWEQMRNILFNQVDEKCHRTSVHYEGSVARPTQSLNGRPLWKCSVNDYVSDVEKRMKSTSSRN